MIGVNTGEYFATQGGHIRFEQALKRVSGKQVFSLAFPEDLDAAIAKLRDRGLAVKEAVPVEIPFYSPHVLIRMFLIEAIVVASDHDADYHAEISAAEQPGVMTAGEKRVIQITVRNAGNNVWLARVPQGWMNVVTAGDRWLTADGTEVVNDLDGRSPIPHDLKRGDQAELTLTVTAPQTEGQYLLEIDMVHEGVTWFYQRGSPTLRWAVTVVK
jgi:hypothetical protein